MTALHNAAQNCDRTQPEVVVTEDGSITCRDSETKELYHNRAGAYTEALVNFVEPLDLQGLCRSAEIVVMDVCFGLGYNTWVFLEKICDQLSRTPEPQKTLSIRVIGLEIDNGIIRRIPACLADPRLQRIGRLFAGDMPRFENGDFGVYRCGSSDHAGGGVTVELTLAREDLRKAVPRLAGEMAGAVDVIFHDPFSPGKHPELWTTDIFSCYRSLMKHPSGRVVTYSAATAVRSGFVNAGFDICRTAAVGKKSGGTMAYIPGQSRPMNTLALAEDESAKLMTASAVPYRDGTFASARLEILKRRDREQVEFRRASSNANASSSAPSG